jgi:hypothetical protein
VQSNVQRTKQGMRTGLITLAFYLAVVMGSSGIRKFNFLLALKIRDYLLFAKLNEQSARNIPLYTAQ